MTGWLHVVALFVYIVRFCFLPLVFFTDSVCVLCYKDLKGVYTAALM